ncbi:MAG: DNA-3-methyladenine glycosylase 2 family protein [Actinomycetota bacterium]|nr:DNA-3-methyladenine glycosylase 2 family protein [Actinomycetota bacterium]
MGVSRFALPARPPFRLDYTAWALRRRPENIIDRWQDGAYSRVLVLEGRPYSVRAVQSGGGLNPQLEVTVRGDGAGRQSVVKPVSELLKKMLSLDADLSGFYALARGNKKLRNISAQFHGLKPPRFASVFEAAVNAVSCQQLSLTVGITLLNRLASAYGIKDKDGAPGFPGPRELSGAMITEIKKIGYSQAKANALAGLAARQEKEDVLGALEDEGDTDAMRLLTSMRGIGRWSAQYILLRGLGRLNIFPEGDSGASRALADWLGPAEAAHSLSRFHPYGGFVYFHLLLRGLESKGYVRGCDK